MEDQPVVEHAHAGGLFIYIGEFILYPQKSGQRSQRIGFSGGCVDLLFQFGVRLHELRHLVRAAGIHIGAGPDLMPVFIVEQDPFPHAGGGDAGDVFCIDARFRDDAADAGAGQFPVMGPVEVHASGEPGIGMVLPFPGHRRDLCALRVEQDRPDAPCAGINGQQVFSVHTVSFQAFVAS